MKNLFFLLSTFMLLPLYGQYKSITTLGTTYMSSFTLTGDPTADATLPSTWLVQDGGTTITVVPSSDGQLSLGSGIYHFGGSSSNDRAIGGIGEDLLVLGTDDDFYYAWRFENNTGDTISNMHINWNQELWMGIGGSEAFTVGVYNNPTTSTDILQNQSITFYDALEGEVDSPALISTVLALALGRSTPLGTNNTNNWVIMDTEVLPGEEFMVVWKDENESGLINNNGVGIDDIEITFYNDHWYLHDNAASHERTEWYPYEDGDTSIGSRPYFNPEEWSSSNNNRQVFVVNHDVTSSSTEDVILADGAEPSELHIAEGVTFTWNNQSASLQADSVFVHDNATFNFNGNGNSDIYFALVGDSSSVSFGSLDDDMSIPLARYFDLTIATASSDVFFPADTIEVINEYRYEPSTNKLNNSGIIRFVGANSVFNQPNYDDELDIDVVIGNGGVLTFSEAPDNEFLMPQLDMQKLDIESGGTMKVKSDQVLNLVGALANDGTFEIADDGVLLQESESAGTGSGVAKLTRNFANPDVVNPDVGKLQYTGSPIIGSTVGPTGSGSDLMAQRVFYAKDGNFNKANFQPIYETGQTTIVPGRGYLLVNVSSNSENAELGATFNGDAFFNGTLNYNIENVFGEVVEDDLDGYHGYSLSNPYPSPISAKEFILENASGGTPLINGSILLYSSALNTADGNIRGTSGGIIVLNATGSSLPPSIATEYEIPDDISDYYITSGQGFLVKSNHPTGGDIVFNNSMRKGADNSDFKSGNSDISYRFWVRLYNSELEDYGLIGFTPDATVAFDNLYDANYQENTTLNVWSEIRNQKYDIQGLPLVEELTDFLPLGFKSNQSGVHHFDIAEKQNWPSNTTIYLFDDRLNLFYDLSQGPYQFDVAPSEVDEEVRDRFFLTFITTATSIDEVVSENGFGLKQSVGSLKVSHDDLESVQLYSTTGQVVGNYSAQGGVANVPTPSKGVYIVRATTTSGNTWAKQVELY